MSSKYERALFSQILVRGVPLPETQFRFAQALGREYRVDFAWPHRMLVVEVDGGAFIGRGGRGGFVSRTIPVGHHQTIEDYRKRNLLNLLHYTVLAFQPEQVMKGEALTEIELELARPDIGDSGAWHQKLAEHVDRLAENDKMRRRVREAKTKARRREAKT